MMSELPCACLCEHVKKKTGRRGGSTSASHRPDRRHTCTRSRTDVTPTQANLWYERGGILCLAGWRGEGGEEAAEVPYVRKSCSLHHKDHMLASESQRGGRARRGRTKRKDYRRTEGGRVCMWISVSFMCQHEKRRDKWIIVHTSTKHTASKNVGTCARARRHTLLSLCAFRPSPFVGFCLSNMYGWVRECEFVDLFTCL